MKLFLVFQLIIFLQDTHEFLLPKDRFRRQTSVQLNSNNTEPGYLPDYRGDKYTDPQRIKDTQALNKPFFDSIGGEPVYPGGVPPKTNNINSTNTYQYDQQYLNSPTSQDNNKISNPYLTNENQMINENNYNVQNPSYTQSVNPYQIQRDYFVPNTYETSTVNYGLLNNGYPSSTTTIRYNPISPNSQIINEPLWKSANPGYLPDYRGDKYTDPQRILDTQNLNKQFFESIGGEPVYPGGVPPKQNIVPSSLTV
uniref:Zasp-like motif domain-containing protein n=1 Tax=Strongyloides stercoralis TaxID=6248 RepID=A0A0K0DUW3_STRER